MARMARRGMPATHVWLCELGSAVEMECTSILHAKSLLDLGLGTADATPPQPPPPVCDKRSKTVDDCKTPELVLGSVKLPDQPNASSSPLSSGDSGMCSCHDSVLSGRNADGDRSSVDSACGSSQNSAKETFTDVYHRQSGLAANLKSGISFLPAYADLTGIIGQLLRTTSRLFALINNGPNGYLPAICSGHLRATVLTDFRRTARDLLNTALAFLQHTETSGCGAFLPHDDLTAVKETIQDLYCRPGHLTLPEQFPAMLRAFSEQVLRYFAKIIMRYLTECTNKDKLVPKALEHLVHLTLFGDELCLDVVQAGGMSALLRLCRQSTTPTETMRLTLRALAVLCGISKGCVQLLSLGGLDLIVRLLCESPAISAVEAAGVLTQLTAPRHSFAALPSSLPKVIDRLLDLIDHCTASESLLLCSAAVANLSLQHISVTEQLYRQNAILRVTQAYNRESCRSIFVQDQMATIFARLSANRYDEALVAQGAIPCLLAMLCVQDPNHPEFCKRVRYKAAICIGTIASRSYGLKAVHDSKGYYALSEVLRLEKGKKNPVGMICSSLMSRLEGKYQLETVV